MLERKETQNEGEIKGSEKTKKMEKPPADPHREYLDMDTDEEEFGKPETPEPEEEPPPEPEKPVFTIEELEQLIQCVKDFTVLPALDDSDWNEECCKVVKEYFQDPSKIILTIFYDIDVLKAQLDFPSDAIEGLTYFLRSPWQIYTPDNIHDTINFGTITGNVENCILKIMENVYSNGIFTSKHWPSVKRNDILTNTNDLLIKITDTNYKLMGLTVLYVPRDGLSSSDIRNTMEPNRDQFVLVADDEAGEEMVEGRTEMDGINNEEELLGRLETVANFWIRQIREAIADENPASTLEKVTDELDFWNCRYDNLQGLCCQLENPSVHDILEKLENTQFTNISMQFYDLKKKLKTAIDEAVSNIGYLSLLTDPSVALEIPEIKENQVAEILYLISFIWLESPFYNSKAKIETLCQALSTQIVGNCRESINLDTIFQGNTTEGKKQLEICINCCEKYKKIYDEHVEIISKICENQTWEVEKENVFNQVDAFVGRCKDVIEICESTVVFGKSSKTVSFGGSNGADYENDCNKIEKLFYENLESIMKVRYKILDVNEATWIEHITLFQRHITELEVMIGNLINSCILTDINSIEENIETLYTLQRYNQRKCVNELLHLKLVDIWKSFDQEIRYSKQAVIDQSEDRHSSNPYYSGRACILRLRQNRLTKYQTMLINASDWLGDCDAQIPILRNYKKFKSATANVEKLLFEGWERILGEDESLTSILSAPVLRKVRSKSFTETVEVNMGYDLLDTLKEAEVWISLGYEVRPLLKKLSSKLSMLKSRYEGAELLCGSYNKTFKRLVEFERCLFKELLKNLDNSIASGFEKITWNSPDVERFYADSTTEISNLQDFIGLYEKANFRIDQIFKEISHIRFIEVKIDVGIYYRVEDFLSRLTNHKSEGMQKVRISCEYIFKLLTGIKEGFEIDFEEIIEYWDHFVKKKDDKLEESLCSVVQSFLQSILKLIQGDEMSIQKSFQIKTDYIGDELNFHEEIQKIQELFKNMLAFIIEDLKLLDSLSKRSNPDMKDSKEFWKSIEKHESCINLQKGINSEVDDLVASINEYINSIDCLKEIAEIDVAQISQYYLANEPNREILETDIPKCTKLADSIENLENEVSINFIVLDMREAKSKMIDICESWREILFIELSKVIVTEQKSYAATPTPKEEMSMCSYDESDDSN